MSYIYKRSEFRFTQPSETEFNETIVFEEGYLADSLERGFFCKVTRSGLCVEAFATSKRKALKLARKSWYKFNEEGYQREYGYPRVVNCED